jgi:TPR repeat protein
LAQRRRPDPWRLMNFPLYIPLEGAELIETLDKSGSQGFMADLARRAELGATWAAAALGFIELQGGEAGTANFSNAERFCTPPAHAGDAYAQYVLAWAALGQNREAEALRWMKRAATSGNFRPACADLGRFYVDGVGIDAPDVDTGMRMLWGAHSLGYKASLLFICDTYRRGRRGFLGRLAACVIAPFAIARYYLALTNRPFSEEVFAFNLQALQKKRPFFRRAT